MAALEGSDPLDHAEKLPVPGSASNFNCAVRTLSRMLHKAEEWKLIRQAHRLKRAREYERQRMARRKNQLLAGAAECGWGKPNPSNRVVATLSATAEPSELADVRQNQPDSEQSSGRGEASLSSFHEHSDAQDNDDHHDHDFDYSSHRHDSYPPRTPRS